jgi:predicted secreted protein with PEFG-CTERM motif
VRGILTILTFVVLFTIPFSTNAFAQTSYEVKMPTGSSDPQAPYFWQSVKDGSTTGVVEILVGDTIVWSNADTAFHTVASGSEADGLDGLFDSKEFAPGKSFTYKFSEIGHYPYYCTLHPWMMGTIIVTSGYSIIPNVGKQVGDGTTFFNVEYDFSRLLSTTIIDEEQKSITFEIIGNAKSENHDLELRLPSGLVDGPFTIWVDGEKISDFENIREGDLNVLFMSLTADSKILTIVGTSIVPEFGTMTLAILGVSIVSMIVLSQRFKLQI